MTEVQRPVANPDGITQPWWDATAEKRLLVQRCCACDRTQHFPRALCRHCGSTDLEYIEATGRGSVHSFTVVHRAPHPAFTAPYVVALVDLHEGVRLLTNVVGCDPDAVHCDMRVRVGWEPLPDGRQLPVFEPDKV